MGTNYYYRHNICDCCGRFDELHIGKSSGGWCFSLHVIPEKEINNLENWKKLFNQENSRIVDEYGYFISPDKMFNVITKRDWIDKSIRSAIDWEVFHERNYSETGPNGLVRHKIDGSHCIGHGEGTWDYIIGDFS